MGSDISSCCGGASDKDTQLDITPAAEDGSRSLESTEHKTAEKDAFRVKFYEGIEVHLILQNKSKLTCQVRLDRQHQFLLLTCDKKVRAIGIKDIKSILHNKDQLKRVESSAGITEIETCAAIHLRATGNCIPLFFKSADDKQLFVECVNDVKSESKNQ